MSGELGDDRAEIAAGEDALARRFAAALELLGGYPENWVPPTPGADHDVVIIGGGQSGLAVSFALRRAGLRNVMIYDAAPAGREGPWITFARMLTLRSRKEAPGPDLGFAALTFRAWYEATRGPAAWNALAKIPKGAWMEYLLWYRRVTEAPMENGVRVTAIAADGPLLRLTLDREGRTASVRCRKVVLATGMDGCGGPAIPSIVAESLPRHLYAHSADPIDFTALRGRRVAVLGAASSAFDNAATALESGAAAVRLFCRQPVVTPINPFKPLSYPGPLRGFWELDDADRWRIMQSVFAKASAPTADTVRRNTRHPNFHLHLAAPIARLSQDGRGLRIETPRGVAEADFLILGTGFTTDLAARPELAGFAGEIALWRDRYTPPHGLECEMAAGYPYLDAGFAFVEKQPGRAPFLRHLHAYNYGATVSHGVNAGGNPSMNWGVPRLVDAIIRDLLRADAAHHIARMTSAVDAELTGEEYRDAVMDDPRRS